MRSAGIEWVYRLAREPRRLFGRYVAGNPLFLQRVVREQLAELVRSR
jgi:UDP-N-acetyl-D-mannosaminuronic acid transferase (WecB/TagA/CpsF family)